MPIRFRCAYCNQLLGIARRKVGTVVRCPTCAGQVVVPDRDAEDLDKMDDPANPPLFERDDFDALFDMPAAIGAARENAPRPKAPPAAVEPAGSWGTHAEPEFDVERLHPAPAAPPPSETVEPKSPGIIISPMKATLLTVAFIAVVALTFLVGLGVGYLLFHA
jgi:DNA-directed RNA polymerase subunit RPC12/RpoP